MAAICPPVIYKDITTDDFPSLVASELYSNKNIEQTTRLHLLHRRRWPEPSYLEIMTKGWTGLDWTKRYTEDVRSDNAILEHQRLGEAGGRMRKLLTAGVTVFPKLQTVSMGSIGDDFFNAHQGAFTERLLDCNTGNHSKRLPLALLDIPTVRHYCQGVAHGPLALSRRFIQPKTALKTYTYHPRGTDPMFCPCAAGAPCTDTCQQPPIILGAINRYYCVDTCIDKHHFEFIADESPLDRFWTRVMAMFTRPGIIFADQDDGTPKIALGDIPDCAYEGTTVEIYSYIRTIDVDIQKRPPKIVAKNQRMLGGIQPPQSLDRHQRALDRGLPEFWKGKVKLFNREDAPPCAACGFDLEGEFQHFVDGLAAQEERESLWKDVD